MVNAEYKKQDKHIVLLDISLFVLDVLSRENIEKNYLKSNIQLEIPGALVNMIEGARSGNQILKQFIRAYLYNIQKNSYHKNSVDPQIQRVVHATEQDLKRMEYDAYVNILNVFSPIIDNVSSRKNIIHDDEHFVSNTSHPIIKRYDSILDVYPNNLDTLRKQYKTILDIQEHPWIDLYFLQIYHAQHIGVAHHNTNPTRRKLLSLGRGTLSSIKIWEEVKKFETAYKDYTFPKQSNRDKSINAFVRDSRNTLQEIVVNFFKKYWRYIAAAAAITADVVLGIPDTGMPGLEHIAMAVIGFGTSEFITKIANPETPPEQRVFFLLLVIFIIIFVFVYYAYKKIPRQQPVAAPLSTATPTAYVVTTENVPTVLPTTETPLPTQTPLFFIETPTITPSPSILIPYCLYVTQLGDTARSISSWFQISEDVFRSENDLIPGTEFSSHVMVTINTSCCAPINNQGTTYAVQKGDTLQSIASQNNLDIYILATDNNLKEPWYIQDGQMLCIPK